MLLLLLLLSSSSLLLLFFLLLWWWLLLCLRDDARDSRQMEARVLEEDEVHRLGRVHVVVAEVLVELRLRRDHK